MAEIPDLCLSLPNRPENVLVVRQALSAVAGSLGLDALETNDLNTAVTEACNNVVLHAYAGGDGPLEVELYAREDAIAVVVRDRGLGVANAASLQETAGGIGVAAIRALSRTVEFTAPPGGGTEVRMEFMAPRAVMPRAPAQAQREEGPPHRRADPVDVEVSLAPSPLAGAVLPRVLSTLAGRAYFSTDRICDVQLVADALAANAGSSISGRYLNVTVGVAPRSLELRIGPLLVGHGESLLSAAADGLAPVVARLADAKRVAPGEIGETLELRLVDQR